MREKVITSGIILSFCLLVSKFFGFIREMLIAKYFGASADVDAYLIATQIPYFASIIISSGITTCFIPIYLKYLSSKDEEGANKFLTSVATFIVILLTLLITLAEVFAPFVVRGFAPGFSDETSDFATNLSRIVIPYFFFSELGMFFQVILQAYSLFGLISLWQVIPNLILIIAIIFFSPKYGIYSLSVGFLITGVVYFFLMLYGILKINIKLKLNFDFSNPGFRKFIKLVIPAICGSSIYILSTLVDRFIASFLGEGSIAILNFAYRINLLPISSVVIALSIVIFPLLSKHSSQNNIEKLSETALLAIRVVFFILIPVFVSFVVLSTPIIRVVYERGNFTPQDTMLAGNVLKFFALSVLGYGISEIITRTFYSQQNTVLPFKITIICVGCNVVLSFILAFFLKISGIALATSLTSILSAYLLFKTSLKKEFVGIVMDKNFLHSILKILFAGILLAILFYFSLYIIEQPYFLATLEKRVFILFLTLSTGLFFYWLISYILKSEEEKIIREKGILQILKRFADKI